MFHSMPTCKNVICTIDYIDPDFVRYNNCIHPCLADENKASLRPINSLVLLDRTQARRSSGNKGDIFGTIRTDREKRETTNQPVGRHSVCDPPKPLGGLFPPARA